MARDALFIHIQHETITEDDIDEGSVWVTYVFKRGDTVETWSCRLHFYFHRDIESEYADVRIGDYAPGSDVLDFNTPDGETRFGAIKSSLVQVGAVVSVAIDGQPLSRYKILPQGERDLRD